jgi:cytochrome c biogenesis protein CcmG/thiol:disulfide interchange protein DsbE
MRTPHMQSSTIRLMTLAALACFAAIGCDRDSRPGQLGHAAPVFSISDGQHTVNLATYRGKVVVLNFWASWCAPCIEEMPTLTALQQELPQIQVIGVASDEDFSQYQTFIAQRHISMLTVFDQNQRSNALYGSFRFPETYIIDKQGIIRRKLIGAQDFTAPDFIAYLKKLAS